MAEVIPIGLWIDAYDIATVRRDTLSTATYASEEWFPTTTMNLPLVVSYRLAWDTRFDGHVATVPYSTVATGNYRNQSPQNPFISSLSTTGLDIGSGLIYRLTERQAPR